MLKTDKLKWTAEIRAHLWQSFVTDFGTLADWEDNPPSPEAFQAWCEKMVVFFREVAKVEFTTGAIRVQISHGLRSPHKITTRQNVGTYMANVVAAAYAGFLDFTDMPSEITQIRKRLANIPAEPALAETE